MSGGLVFGLLLLGAFLYLFVPRRSSTAASEAPVEVDGPEVKTIWATAAYFAAGSPLEAEHLLLAALHHDGVARIVRGSVDDVRAKLLASIASRAKTDPTSSDPTNETIMVFGRAQQMAMERGEKTRVRDLIASLRESQGVFADVLPIGDLGTMARRHPRPKKVGPDGRTPYRSPDSFVDVYAKNDNQTSMDFVLSVLQTELLLPESDAVYAMYETHYCGLGFVGRWPLEEAKSRIARADERARAGAVPFSFRVDG